MFASAVLPAYGVFLSPANRAYAHTIVGGESAEFPLPLLLLIPAMAGAIFYSRFYAREF